MRTGPLSGRVPYGEGKGCSPQLRVPTMALWPCSHSAAWHLLSHTDLGVDSGPVSGWKQTLVTTNGCYYYPFGLVLNETLQTKHLT